MKKQSKSISFHPHDKPWPIDDIRWKHVYRWMWIWSPEDYKQIVSLAYLIHGKHARQGTIYKTVKYLLQQFRHDVWDIKPTKPPKMPNVLKSCNITKRHGFIPLNKKSTCVVCNNIYVMVTREQKCCSEKCRHKKNRKKKEDKKLCA
jgi:hypothetical protein